MCVCVGVVVVGVVSQFRLSERAAVGRGFCEGNALQFVLPPGPRAVVEAAAAAAPHAQVLPEQLVHPFLTVPLAGRLADTYEPTIALLWGSYHGRANELPVSMAPPLKAPKAFGQADAF